MSKPLKKIVDATLMEVQKYSQQIYDKLPDQEYWIDKANTWRSTIIRDLQRTRLYPMAFFQTANFQIQKVTQEATVDGISVSSKTNVYAVTFPEINDNSWKDIAFFGTDKNFSRKSLEGFNNNEGNRFTKHMPCYVIVGGEKAYIKNLPTPGTQVITMTSIFVNPLNVPGYVYETTTYPISEMYLPKLEYLLKKDVFTYLGLQMPQQKQEDEQREQS